MVASLVLHLLVFGIFAGWLIPRMDTPKKPVYFVDLTTMPVKDPQAGRPDAPAAPDPKAPKAPEAKAEPKPPAKPEVKVPPKPEPKPEPKTPPKAEPKLPAKPEPKPTLKPEPKAPAKPVEKTADYSDVQAKLADMKRKQQAREDMDALKQKLAALTSSDTRGKPSVPDAPLGMPQGKGKEVGVDQATWLNAFYKANWSLSKYQVMRLDLQINLKIVYDAKGNLLDYSIVKASGDGVFDDSVRKAVLKEKKLPFEPGQRLELDVVFNLKDLMEK